MNKPGFSDPMYYFFNNILMYFWIFNNSAFSTLLDRLQIEV